MVSLSGGNPVNLDVRRLIMMNKITIVTSMVGTVIGVGTLATGVWQYRRKIHLEIFRTYADRYNAIHFPSDLTCKRS